MERSDSFEFGSLVQQRQQENNNTNNNNNNKKNNMSSSMLNASMNFGATARASSARRMTQTTAAAAAAATMIQQQQQQELESTSKPTSKKNQIMTTTDKDGMVEVVASIGDVSNNNSSNSSCTSSLVEAMCYRGHDVLIATTTSSPSELQIICARTRSVLQSFVLPSEIVALHTLVGSGLICVATSRGCIHTYRPIPTLPHPPPPPPATTTNTTDNTNQSSKSTTTSEVPVVTLYGRYAWIVGPIIYCQKVFRRKSKSDVDMFVRIHDTHNNYTNSSVLEEDEKHRSKGVWISSSLDGKVLVAHKDQLAIYQVAIDNNNSKKKKALLLWTTRTRATILQASLSGDGRAMAIVLQKEGVGVPHPHGVRTFVRDIHDGSNSNVIPSLELTHSSGTAATHTLFDPPPLPPSSLYDQLNDNEDEDEDEEEEEDDDDDNDVGIGILYKPGPFLIHSGCVTRLKFRGQGLCRQKGANNGSSSGNDLLMTCCGSSDGSMRIFSQSSWKQLMHWTTPPHVSRADWIQGITAANLGDLEPPPKSKNKSNSSNNNNYNNMDQSAHSSSVVGMIHQQQQHQHHLSSSHPVPENAAGAWIVELTFRGPFPALRLSRLSYLKDAAPAHFESVAAILPPGALYNANMTTIVQGIWPAWNAWEKQQQLHDIPNNNTTMTSSAMALLGAPTPTPPTNASLNNSYHGLALSHAPMDGTHAPPCELRLITSTTTTNITDSNSSGGIIWMEFPLWGDKEFGAMELGSPLRYCLHLSPNTTSTTADTKLEAPLSITTSSTYACMDYDSSKVCASISSKDGRSISILWRKPGTMSILPLDNTNNNNTNSSMTRSLSMESVASTVSIDSTTESHASFDTHNDDGDDSDGLKQYQDLSLLPCPLMLPSIFLPPQPNKTTTTFASVQWWPDENFGGPPRMVATTTDGTLLVYEMPPPWSALEPAMPSYDPFASSTNNSIAARSVIMDDDDEDDLMMMGGNLSYYDDEEEMEYDVDIVPHSDFGLGLRLDAQVDGMPALAGSYKKHPLSGGMLPAEKSGRITLGDELIAVNDQTLIGMSFESIISTIRRVGLDTPKGKPLHITFRRNHNNSNSNNNNSSSNNSQHRRTLEQMFDSKSSKQQRLKQQQEGSVSYDGVSSYDGETKDGAATILVGADNETQQEFSRIVAMVPNAFTATNSNLVLLPWNYGKGAPVDLYNCRGITLLICASGNILTAYRLEVWYGHHPEDSCQFTKIGSIYLPNNDNNNDKTDDTPISSVHVVKTGGEGWCLAVCNRKGQVSLVFVDVEEETRNNHDKNNEEKEDMTLNNQFKAIFRPFLLLDCNSRRSSKQKRDLFLIRAFSVDLLATMPMGIENCGVVTIWSALPSATKFVSKRRQQQQHKKINENYTPITIYHKQQQNKEEEPILDFQWMASGSLDSFPWLVTFGHHSAILHRCPGSTMKWTPVVELFYPSVHNNHHSIIASTSTPYAQSIRPVDRYPHLLSSLKSIVTATDERKWLRCDWHPDSILANICTEQYGAQFALQQSISGLFTWLSQFLSKDISRRPIWNSSDKNNNSSTNISSAPFHVVYDEKLTPEDARQSNEKDESLDSAASLMSSIRFKKVADKAKNMEEILLEKLQEVLDSHLKHRVQEKKKEKDDIVKQTVGKYSKEFILAMAAGGKSADNEEESKKDDVLCPLPEPIQQLSQDEVRFLWIMGQVLHHKPEFQNLDAPAQLTSFCTAFMRTVETVRDEDQLKQQQPFSATFPTFGIRRSFSMNAPTYQPSSNTNKDRTVTIASAGGLSALLSNSQTRLIMAVRKKDEDKFDWETARSLWLPFWIRSDDELKKVSEEIGDAIYKSTRDVMECALYFIITGNKRKLRALAATDKSISGTKFLTFLTNHDFSSARGRTIAEKNAYSLLRKRQYNVAASFFLLAEPPLIRSALNIIETQLEDFNLAFLVARLVEKNTMASSDGNAYSSLNGSGYALHSMGGGGGYASFGSPTLDHNTTETKFSDWKPILGEETKNLLTMRGLSFFQGDACIQAMILLWLGRNKEAYLCLAGRSYSDSDAYKDKEISDCDFPSLFSNNCKKYHTDSASERLLSKSNQWINFTSRPFLLKQMNAFQLVQWSSAINVAQTLSRRGMELPSSKLLLQIKEINEDEKSKPDTELVNLSDSKPHKPTSIFDSYDTAPPKPSTAPMSGGMSSSIFDSFDSAPPSQKPFPPASAAAPASGGMSSSIFDSFGAAPQQPNSSAPISAAPASGGMSSSIFDSFDAAPPPRKSTPSASAAAPASGAMSSSIFDSFDAAPQPPKPSAAAPASGAMSSSIFDSFDVAPQRPKPSTAAPSSGGMSSSIFDSFDVAPQRPKPSAAAPASGGMSSSIFDSFDSAPPSRKSTTSKTSQNSVSDVKNDEAMVESELELNIPVPSIWHEWRLNLLASTVARRLIRDMAHIISRFNGDAIVTPMKLFRRHTHPLVPAGAAETLHDICPGESLMSSLEGCLQSLCQVNGVAKEPIVEQGLILLGSPLPPRRIVLALLLYRLINRIDLVEDVIRSASQDQIERCNLLTIANDDIIHKRKTLHHSTSHFVRRQASIVSWQLELCLWLHRGGMFEMSPIALKEATIAVRVGIVIASWGRCYENLEHLLKCEPDSLMDQELGRQLWSSMKLISSHNDKAIAGGGTSSGGWEFLVDCKRAEATEILRERKPGSFLLRPHAEDHGVFTLSFKTNLVPTVQNVEIQADTQTESKETSLSSKKDEAPKSVASSDSQPVTQAGRTVKRDEVVQHAILRLSDAGFRCGSFGPFTTLMDLLNAVSTSLPFDLLFHEPPTQGIIQEQGTQPSPNSVYLRKLALCSRTENYRWNSSTQSETNEETSDEKSSVQKNTSAINQNKYPEPGKKVSRQKRFGLFSNLLALTEIRKQLSAIAAAEYDDTANEEFVDDDGNISLVSNDFERSLSDSMDQLGEEEMDALASRMLRPFLYWCRCLEVTLTYDIAPPLENVSQQPTEMPIAVDASETAVEMTPSDIGSGMDGGDAVIRRMIQPTSGVEFRTLRVGEGGQSVVVVLFSKNEAISWIVSSGAEKNETEAMEKLQRMEKRRVIERIDLSDLAINKTLAGLLDTSVQDPEKEIRYRFVDPWEVEVLSKKEDELKPAALGRERYLAFSVGVVAQACEEIQRSLGGLHFLALWATAKGGISLTKAIISAHPPWERDSGGDLNMLKTICNEPSPYINSIREHLYRNALFRRLNLPQRFLALIQVELLDLKNLSAPGGTISLTAYAILRLKRISSSTTLTQRARTLDSAYTEPKKIGKISGPHAPASWGSIVRFRFPLPEDVDCDGTSYDMDREALFRGPPCVLQLAVYEKKFISISDTPLGGADIKLDALASGGQLEEWVPLRDGKDGITWFARVRLTLRFELMCLESEKIVNDDALKSSCPSVGLKKIRDLSRTGGAHEASKGFKKSVSTPDFVAYLESMVY